MYDKVERIEITIVGGLGVIGVEEGGLVSSKDFWSCHQRQKTLFIEAIDYAAAMTAIEAWHNQ